VFEAQYLGFEHPDALAEPEPELEPAWESEGEPV
jgi:hypothetical protein